MVKMIFSDFDNTMLCYHSDKNKFSEYQIDILKKVKDKGIKFCIVTGRCVSFFYNNFKEILEYVDYIISNNGACIYDVKEEKYIDSIYIEKSDFDKLVDYIEFKGYDLLFNYEDGQYDSIDDASKVREICNQVVLFFGKDKYDEVLIDFSNIPGFIVNNIAEHVDYVSIDINNKLVSKGESIKKLCDILNIDKEDTIGFGDGDNDISMFYNVGNSVCPDNASDKIKLVAKEIIKCAYDDGIYEYIEDKILK